MQCLYCDRRLGLFHSAKGAFCSDHHAELFRNAEQRRLEAPHVASVKALENAALQAQSEAAHVEDLAQLLKATQSDRGVSIQTPAEVIMASVTNSTSAANVNSVPQTAQAAPLTHAEPFAAPAARESEKFRSDPQWSLLPDPPPAAVETPTDRRGEPRVKDMRMVKVATLRDPEQPLSCALVDTSDAGIQFTADTGFRTGEVLIVELPDQLVLIEVKYSQAKDGRYAVGAERAQSIPCDGPSAASSGLARAELLIQALCDRVRTGFADEPQPATAEAGSHQRARALEMVARILEVWHNTQTDRAPAARETPADLKPSSGAGRAFAAVAAALVIAGLLTLCVLQFQKSGRQGAGAPINHAPALAPPVQPIPQAAPAAPVLHRAQIKAIQTTWLGISTDGNKIFGGMIAKGTAKDLEYSKFAFLHAGNATGVEIIVDGQPVPMGSQPRLRLVELNTTGYRFLRWNNDDPPHP